MFWRGAAWAFSTSVAGQQRAGLGSFFRFTSSCSSSRDSSVEHSRIPKRRIPQVAGMAADDPVAMVSSSTRQCLSNSCL